MPCRGSVLGVFWGCSGVVSRLFLRCFFATESLLPRYWVVTASLLVRSMEWNRMARDKRQGEIRRFASVPPSACRPPAKQANSPFPLPPAIRFRRTIIPLPEPSPSPEEREENDAKRSKQILIFCKRDKKEISIQYFYVYLCTEQEKETGAPKNRKEPLPPGVQIKKVV